MDKPKEFWILEDDNLFLEVTRYNPDSSDYNAFRVFHVIEFSAYEQLQSKLDKVCAALEEIAKPVDLDSSILNRPLDNMTCALEALAEIRKKDDNE